jgi:hypothetical protein
VQRSTHQGAGNTASVTQQAHHAEKSNMTSTSARNTSPKCIQSRTFAPAAAAGAGAGAGDPHPAGHALASTQQGVKLDFSRLNQASVEIISPKCIQSHTVHHRHMQVHAAGVNTGSLAQENGHTTSHHHMQKRTKSAHNVIPMPGNEDPVYPVQAEVANVNTDSVDRVPGRSLDSNAGDCVLQASEQEDGDDQDSIIFVQYRDYTHVTRSRSADTFSHARAHGHVPAPVSMMNDIQLYEDQDHDHDEADLYRPKSASADMTPHTYISNTAMREGMPRGLRWDMGMSLSAHMSQLDSRDPYSAHVSAQDAAVRPRVHIHRPASPRSHNTPDGEPNKHGHTYPRARVQEVLSHAETHRKPESVRAHVTKQQATSGASKSQPRVPAQDSPRPHSSMDKTRSRLPLPAHLPRPNTSMGNLSQVPHTHKKLSHTTNAQEGSENPRQRASRDSTPAENAPRLRPQMRQQTNRTKTQNQNVDGKVPLDGAANAKRKSVDFGAFLLRQQAALAAKNALTAAGEEIKAHGHQVGGLMLFFWFACFVCVFCFFSFLS